MLRLSDDPPVVLCEILGDVVPLGRLDVAVGVIDRPDGLTRSARTAVDRDQLDPGRIVLSSAVWLRSTIIASPQDHARRERPAAAHRGLHFRSRPHPRVPASDRCQRLGATTSNCGSVIGPRASPLPGKHGIHVVPGRVPVERPVRSSSASRIDRNPPATRQPSEFRRSAPQRRPARIGRRHAEPRISKLASTANGKSFSIARLHKYPRIACRRRHVVVVMDRGIFREGIMGTRGVGHRLPLISPRPVEFSRLRPAA